MSDKLKMSLGERMGGEEECMRRAIENKTDNLRVAMPGKIITFDEANQTAAVQPLIKEQIRGKWESLPQLLDVPCVFPRAGGYCLTFPVKPDDECLIVFNDMCLDSWWQSGGEQIQLECRRHDLSDAACHLGIQSVPRAVTDYSINSMRLRNEDNDSFFEIMDDDKTVNIVGAENINIEAEADLCITVSGSTTINTTGNTVVKSGGNVDITAATINLNGTVIVNGAYVARLGDEVTYPGGILQLSENVNAGD